jgi:hypothetical protein
MGRYEAQLRGAARGNNSIPPSEIESVGFESRAH